MRYPEADWLGANPANFSTTKNRPRFIVVHIMQGTLTGCDGWFHNARAQVSAHFGIGKNGKVHQYVDTDHVAYAQMAYNDKAISIEHEGRSGEHLTAAQRESLMALMEWISKAYKIPLVWVKDGDGMMGVTGHGNLGVDGGNHPSCPGTPIKADVQEMLTARNGLPAKPANKTRPNLTIGAFGLDVIYLQHKLHIPADGQFGSQTLASVKHFQRLHNLTVDGVVGAKTWFALEKN